MTSGIAALGALVVAGCTAGGVLLQWLSVRRDKQRDKDEREQFEVEKEDRAREEAESLATTRGEMVGDLRSRVDDLQRQLGREQEHSTAAIKRLEEALKLSRDEAQETQRLLVVGFRGVLVKLHGHLDADPLELEAAKVYVAEMLAGDLNVRSSRKRTSS